MSTIRRYVNWLRAAWQKPARLFPAGRICLEQIGERRGRGEQVALSFVALLGDQELGLGLGLDALGDDAQTEGVAQRDGRAAHRARLVIVADFLDEGAVDHDAVERAVAQPPERHVARAEVVDEHAHALAAQLVQGGEARRDRWTASAR